MKYVCQVENKVTSIFALDEGILIEFTIQHMPSYLDIKDSISFKTQSEAGRTKPPPRSRLQLP